MRREKRHVLKEKKGMALLFVLCLFALLMALGASMFFAAASTVSNVARTKSEEQASLSAKSFCDVIKKEMTDQHSELKAMADRLQVGDEMSVTAALPGRNVEVEAVLTRTKAKFAAASVTVTADEKKSKMNIGFARHEEEREIPAEDGGDPQIEIIITWSFSGYGYPI